MTAPRKLSPAPDLEPYKIGPSHTVTGPGMLFGYTNPDRESALKTTQLLNRVHAHAYAAGLRAADAGLVEIAQRWSDQGAGIMSMGCPVGKLLEDTRAALAAHAAKAK